MFLLHIKFDQMSFETKGRQNLQKIVDFVIKSIVFSLLFRHVGFLLLAPPPLGIRQQSMSPISMAIRLELQTSLMLSFSRV